MQEPRLFQGRLFQGRLFAGRLFRGQRRQEPQPLAPLLLGGSGGPALVGRWPARKVAPRLAQDDVLLFLLRR